MIKKYSVAVYPPKEEESWKLIKKYIQLVKSYGCKEIFSSAHLPEIEKEKQFAFLERLAKYVHDQQLMLTVDFGGSSLKQLLQDAEWKRKISCAGIDNIRLDYGYLPSMMEICYEDLGIKTFTLNASILKKEELIYFLNKASALKDVRILSCHNFYPRPESGLDLDFMKQQYQLFSGYGIEVMACVASLTHARVPLYSGLPTAEVHRYIGVERAALELERLEIADSVLVGDEFLSMQELQELYRVVTKQSFLLNCYLYEGITEKERHILFHQPHDIRYDSNSQILRSQSSREMSEYADRICPHGTTARNTLSITIDNEKYLRYSGEVQFVLQDLPADDRVNVLGRIDQVDAWKLLYAKQGYSYQLVECKVSGR